MNLPGSLGMHLNFGLASCDGGTMLLSHVDGSGSASSSVA